MFHAVSLHPVKPKPGLMGAPALAVNVDQALALAYRYSRIEAGMRQEQLQASLTAVVDRGLGLQEEKSGFAVGMLEQSSVRVRAVGEMAEIAEDVRRELRA